MSIQSSYEKYICGLLNIKKLCDFSDKEKMTNQHITYMLNRTQSMFKWGNLPETIPQRELELQLQINGNVAFFEYKNDLYALAGGLGGKPNVYYMPTLYTISNPALNYSVSLIIDKECVVMPNDSMYIGVMPLYNRYATLLTETELSMQVSLINSRIVDLISAPDDRTKESAEKYLSDIASGKLGVIAENVFLDGIRSQPYGTNSRGGILTQLIEMVQYVKASWYNEIGLNANYNMKRERLTMTENQMNNDALLPLVDNMLYSRKQALDKINKMYNTSISVSLNSSWEDNVLESDVIHSTLESELSGQPENRNGGIL